MAGFFVFPRFSILVSGMWRRWIARNATNVEVAGSSPAIPIFFFFAPLAERQTRLVAGQILSGVRVPQGAFFTYFSMGTWSNGHDSGMSLRKRGFDSLRSRFANGELAFGRKSRRVARVVSEHTANVMSPRKRGGGSIPSLSVWVVGPLWNS